MKLKDAITMVEAGEILGLDPSAIRHRILAEKYKESDWEKVGTQLFISRKVIEAEAREKKQQAA